jgi:hypothetical protein
MLGYRQRSGNSEDDAMRRNYEHNEGKQASCLAAHVERYSKIESKHGSLEEQIILLLNYTKETPWTKAGPLLPGRITSSYRLSFWSKSCVGAQCSMLVSRLQSTANHHACTPSVT